MISKYQNFFSLAKRWAAERESGYENFDKLREMAGQANPFTPIETRVRAAMRAAHERGEAENR